MIVLVSGVFRYQILAIASNSMNDTFNRGDAVIIKKLKVDDINNIKVGDIIAFKKDKVLVVHRVIEKTKDENNEIIFKTKGDSNITADGGYIKKVRWLVNIV